MNISLKTNNSPSLIPSPRLSRNAERQPVDGKRKVNVPDILLGAALQVDVDEIDDPVVAWLHSCKESNGHPRTARDLETLPEFTGKNCHIRYIFFQRCKVTKIIHFKSLKKTKIIENRISDINPNVDHVELGYYFFLGASKVEGRDGTWTLPASVPARLKLRCPTANCNTWYVIEKEIEDAVRDGKEATADVRCQGNTDYKHAIPHPTCSCEGWVRLVIRPVLKEV